MAKRPCDPVGRAIAGMRRPAVIVASGQVRSVAADHFVVFVRGELGNPTRGASDYLLSGAPPGKGLDNGFLNDFGTNPRRIDELMRFSEVRDIVLRVYGDDVHFAIDRYSVQLPSAKQSPSDLAKTLHVDYPRWTRSSSCPPPLVQISIPTDHFAVIVIDQGSPHGIPIVGDSTSVFFAAMRSPEFTLYREQTMHYLATKKPPAKPQHWLALSQLRSYNQVIAALLLTGARPPLYPSGKPIALPQPFNGHRYKFFEGYKLPPQDLFVLADVLMQLEHSHPTVGSHFAEAARALELGPRCACDPSSFDPDTLARFFSH